MNGQRIAHNTANEVRYDGARALGNALKINTTLTTLDFSGDEQDNTTQNFHTCMNGHLNDRTQQTGNEIGWLGKRALKAAKCKIEL